MFKMTQLIYETLKQDDGLKVFTDESDTSSSVWLQFGIKNGGSYKIKFISTDNDNDVAVRVFALLSVDDSQRDKLLPAINELNSKYRFVRFWVDEDGDVNIGYDYPMHCPNPASSARELIIRIVKIVDDAYPLLMRAMWA